MYSALQSFTTFRKIISNVQSATHTMYSCLVWLSVINIFWPPSDENVDKNLTQITNFPRLKGLKNEVVNDLLQTKVSKYKLAFSYLETNSESANPEYSLFLFSKFVFISSSCVLILAKKQVQIKGQ